MFSYRELMVQLMMLSVAEIKLEGMKKVVVMTLFESLSRYSYGGTKKIHDRLCVVW
jgi:uncharacterized protein Smg (DUF494 family)